MNITINIENDQELRSTIKDMIKGQVMALARDDITEILSLEIERKIKNSNSNNFDRMLNNAIEKAVEKIMRNELKISFMNDKFIQPSIDRHIDKIFGQFQLTDEKIQKKIDESVKLKLKLIVDSMD